MSNTVRCPKCASSRIEGFGTEGDFTNTTVGSLSASTLSSDVGSFSQESNLSINPESFLSDSSSVSGSGTGGSNRSVDIDNSNNATTNTQNTTNQNIDNSINIGDVINTVNNEITELTETLSTVVNNLTENVTTILNDFGVTNVLTDVSNITHQVTGSITNVTNNILDGEIALNLDLDVLDTLESGLNISIEDSIEGSLDIDATTENLASLTNDLTGLSLPDSPLLDADIDFNLLSGENVNDGNDVSVAGVSTPDIDLDSVEDLVGDIDVSLEAPTELLEGDTVMETLQESADSVNNLEIANVEDGLDILGEQDAEGSIEAVIEDIELSEEFDIGSDNLLADATDTEEINLAEVIEDISSDIDLGDTLSLLDTSTTDQTEGSTTELGAEDDIIWTDSTIGDSGMFDDLVDGLGGEADILPEPSGTVSEGLGILDMDTDSGGTSLGGLFG